MGEFHVLARVLSHATCLAGPSSDFHLSDLPRTSSTKKEGEAVRGSSPGVFPAGTLTRGLVA